MTEFDAFKSTEGVLYNYAALKAEIKNLELEIEEQMDEYNGISAISCTEKTSPTYKIGDSVASEVIKMENTILKLQRAMKSKERLIHKFDNAIESLTETEQKFIKYRYTDNVKRSWEQVGTLMNLDPNHCCNKLRPAIINKLSCLIFVGYKI